ncbi:MAG: hypothetical protein R2874_11085 [Desulfobacterales bacterium]
MRAPRVLYRQFSITIISSMLLSVIVALILDPGPLRLVFETHSR